MLSDRASKPKVLVLMGPTTCGKSAIAMSLAHHGLPIEIINADATAVYRGFDIGSAKPSPADQSAVPHHLLDIRGAEDPYTAHAFCQDAHDAIQTICDRGRLPAIVGGTAMYLHAWHVGLSSLPVASPSLRDKLEKESLENGLAGLYQRLVACDPETAIRLHPNDKQRIVRALEIYLSSGQPMSQQLGRLVGGACERYSIHAYCFAPEKLSDLKPRISERLQQMMVQGFESEVRNLIECYGWESTDLPAFRSIGYRQMVQHLRQKNRPWEETILLIERATYQLAKRQMTWLRRWPGRLRRYTYDRSEGAVEEILQSLSGPDGWS